jgi:4-amino-4-deoxy-L-arabinose transferase-like glycosyltransferase
MNDLNLDFGLVLFLLLGGLGWVILTLTRNHSQTMRLQLKLFLWAFGLRFGMSLAIYQFGLVSVLGDDDAIGWNFGVSYYNAWQRVSFLDLPSVLMGAFEGNHRGYYYLLGTLFYFTDSPGRFPAAVLNCFFGALTVVFAYRIARSLFSEWVAVRVGWWTCLFPSLIIWSAQTVKEPAVILLETLALYCCVRLKRSGFSTKYILVCAIAIVLVIPFRFYAAYIVGAAVALTLVLPQIGRRMTFGSAIGVAALVIPILFLSGVFVQNESKLAQFDLQSISKFRKDVATGEGSASGVSSNYDLQSTGGLVLGTAEGAAHLLLAPFPWQLLGGSARKLGTMPELVVWWWLFFAGLIPGVWYAVRHRFNDIQPLVFFLLGLGWLYSTMFGNVGLAYRQRAQLVPWLLIFAMVGLEQRALKRHAARRSKVELPIAGQWPAGTGRQTPFRPAPGSQPTASKS